MKRAMALAAPPTAAVVVATPRRHLRERWFVLSLGVITLVALALRAIWLWPPARAVVQAPYDDEGVYVMAAQLLWQGHLPYRDYFFAHPPLGVLAIAPALGIALTPWGSVLSFGLARLWMVGLSAAMVPVIGLAAARVWGPAGGLIAAGVLAIDPGSVANGRHVLLETPMGLLVAAALLAGTWRGRGAGLVSGSLAGLATLVKVQAGLLVAALVIAALIGRRGVQAGYTLLGAAVAGALLVPLALLVGPEAMLRQVVLFQVLRPADGLVDWGERVAALGSPAGLLFGLLCGLAGLTVATLTGRARATDAWWPAALWVGLGLASFLVTRSFYQHYTSQLLPGLALLAGGLGTALTREATSGRAVAWRPVALLAGLVALAAIVVGPLANTVAPRPDPMFVTVARYMVDATPPTGTTLATDAQFNVLASRPLPRAGGGYLLDSYGHLTYAGLGLGDGSLAEQVGRVLAPRDPATVDEVIWRPAAQALLRQHLGLADLVVIHAVGQRRMTPETRQWLGESLRLVERTRRYDIYRRGQ